MLLVLIIIILILGGGGWQYGNNQWGPTGGVSVSLGAILVILLIAYLLGVLPGARLR